MTRRVLIATPAYDSRVDARYAHALAESYVLTARAGIELRSLIVINESSGPAHARNCLVRDAIRYGFDDLIWVDDDQDFEPQWILDLIGYPVDIVGAAIRKKTDDQELFNVRSLGGVYAFVQHPTENLWTAPEMILGTGFLRMSRKALMALWDNSPPYKNGDQDVCHWIFKTEPINGELVSEDNHAAVQLLKMGFQYWIAPHMKVGHVGTKRWDSDFAGWVARTKAEHEFKTAT